MNQNFFVGIVENRNDPLKLGRCQVRVFGVHSESLDDVPTSALPWAIPMMPATSASLSGIGHSGSQYLEGSTVFLFFMDGESKQNPIIMGSMHGIPMHKNPLEFVGDDAVAIATQDIPSKQTSSVKATADNTLVDSSGEAVTDSSGDSVNTDAPETVEGPLDLTKIKAKFPNAKANIDLFYKTIMDFGIKEPNAIIAIMSNAAKECGFVPKRENMSYTTRGALEASWGKTFKPMSDAEISTYFKNAEKLCNKVYSNKYGNGSTESGDGFRYRGGGFLQVTFKGTYELIGKKIGVDFASNPLAIETPAVAAKASVQWVINAYKGVNRITFPSVDAAIRDMTMKVNKYAFDKDFPKVEMYSKLFSKTGTPEETKVEEKKEEAAKEIANPNDPVNDVKKDATKKEIDSGIVAGNTNANNATGFKDPSDKYPIKSLLKEQDTNRLARRNTDQTIITTKIKNRREEMRSIGSSFAEPAPPYNAQYPYNHVYSTESGHALEFDDTSGNERINIHHTSGTYSEIDKYGNQVNKIMGDNFSITERNGYVYIDGTARITIGSDCKLVVGGNLEIEVDGDIDYNIGGDAKFNVGGDFKVAAAGRISLNAGADVAIDGSMIDLMNGASDPMSPSGRSGESNDYPLQTPENFSGAEQLKFDGGSDDEIKQNIKQQIKAGTVTQKQIDDGAKDAKSDAPVDEKPPKNAPEALPTSCASFAGKTSIPDTTQLSKYYTLGMLSSKTACTHDTVQAQQGLTLPEIVCNLKTLAENCLDVIKAKYPKMLVTSCFRKMGANKRSQHPLGQACDMQFGVGKSEMFEICTWIKDNVLFDQLLLEYKTTGTGNPWIHISFSSKSNRKEVKTFMNDKSVCSGLKKLQG